MIIDERMASFINSFDNGHGPFLSALEKKAKEDNVPIIRTDMQNLLKLIVTAKQPKEILEVGCAVGFSALLMMQYAPKEARLTTIEKFEKRIPEAKKNFQEAGEDRITLLEGDAIEILKGLEGQYDLIFMDAAKAQYIHFLPDVLRLLAPGGVLISDNVLQEGEIIESRFAVTRRDRTIHERMRDYLFAITHNDALTTAILPVGDGVTISYKK